MDYQDIFKAKRAELAERYKCIGKGTSRIVFGVADSNIAIKYAIQNGKGESQNRIEYDTYQYASDYVDILCPVLDASDDDRILLMARAIPITKFKELDEDARTAVRAFKKRLKLIEKYYHSDRNPLPTRKYWIGYGDDLTDEQIESIKEDSLFQDICTLVLEFEIADGDIFRISSWGYLDGKIVLVDYGLNEDLLNRAYRPIRKALACWA